MFGKKGLPITDCIQGVKSSKQTSGDQKSSGTKKAAVPIPHASLPAKPLQPSTSSRTTNNSLSNLLPIPAKKSPLPTPATQTSHSRTAPPPASTSHGHNVPSRPSTLNSARHIPLVVQTGSAVKTESPQMGSLNSPVTLSAVDRLAPIRAAKATLASGTGVQSPSVSRASETRAILSSGGDTPQTPAEVRQNPAVPQQTTGLLQQHPLPPLPTQPSSQHPPAKSGQGHPIPAQLQGVLQALQSQFPQLGIPAQSTSNNGGNPATSGQNQQPSGNTGHPVMPLPMPGSMNTSTANDPGHTSWRSYNGNIMGTQANPNQAGSHGQWPSSSSGMSRNVTSHQQQPTMNFSTSTPAGPHSLPQRPAPIASAPRNSMRAEPLGPPSRSVSSESAILDGRRGGPYDNHRHRPPDDRQSNRHDRNRYDGHGRGKRGWHRQRP